MELLLAGIDPEEANGQRFFTFATTHKDWRKGAGMRDVLDLVRRGMDGEGAPEGSLWVLLMATTFAPPKPTFKDHLNSDILSAHQVEAYAPMALYWLETLMRLNAASGTWQRVGVGLAQATEANKGALDSALESLPSEAALQSVVGRQLPIAKIINIYNDVSQRVFRV